jgi:cell division transport system permease protein
MIRHAVAEGWLLLRQRGAVSLVLALALAVPISLAGMGLTLRHWLGPMVGLAGQSSTVAVLLHPRLDDRQRRKWIADETAAHPEWLISEVSNEDLVNRLGRWFPYLDELVASGDASLPPLIEIVTAVPESTAVLEDRPEVLAVGPRSSIQQSLGRVSRHLAWAMGVLSAILLAGAVLLAAVWVHLEVFRHADEITIMRLVGATERTIRGPFLVAVAIPGAVAAVLSIIGSITATSGLSRLTSDLGLSPIAVPPAVLVAQAAASLVLPVVAALLTLARHATDELEG